MTAAREQTSRNVRCFALVFACFLYSSAGYLSWMYHLVQFAPTSTVDVLTMVGGYLCQAAGIAAFGIAVGRGLRVEGKAVPIAALVCSPLCLAPALLGTNFAGVLAFGYLANALFGFLAGYYLHSLARDVPACNRATVFGGAYGAATIAAWLLSLPGSGNFLREPAVMLVYVALAAIVGAIIATGGGNAALPGTTLLQREAGRNAARVRGGSFPPDALRTEKAGSSAHELESLRTDAHRPAASQQTASAGAGSAGAGSGRTSAIGEDAKRLLALAAGVVVLFSLVKNMGFSFPLSDVESGLNLELSRIAYAAGLVIAGFVSDRSRRYGALLCLVSLVSPFIMLALAGEPISSTVFWCLDYFFFGFFAVFRIVLFADAAERDGLWWLAGAGLLCGRVGDALGTALCTALGASTIALVLATALLFAVAVFLFVFLYQHLFAPRAQAAPSERELFERFCARHDLSAREREVLRLIIDEKTNSEIAATLFVSESTVKFHVHNLLKKTGCKNRLEIITLYASSSQLPDTHPAAR